ncbi:MAG: SufD family Fe-S cluster assembly protein [Clostridiales bacterium]|nr:SufD family Fe-S cluster assembly protein [Clostridiales bacterium]
MTKELKVNLLPAKTFRYLKVNDAKLDLSGQKISKSESKINSKIRKSFDNVNTGMGKELDAFVSEYAEKKFIKVPSGKDKTVSIKNLNQINQYLFIVESEGSLTVTIENSGEKDFSGISTKFILAPKSTAKLVVVQTLERKGTYFLDVGSDVSDDAVFEFVNVVLGGEKNYVGCNASLIGEKASFVCDTGYICKEKQSLDINYRADQVSKKTQSKINVGGVLGKGGSKTFRGTIDFKVGSSGSVGGETEDVLTIGDDVVNKSVPLILCGEEDVEGQHGATIGSLADEVLYYMNSRGIDKSTAIKMAAHASVMKTASKIEDKKLVASIEEEIDRKV